MPTQAGMVHFICVPCLWVVHRVPGNVAVILATQQHSCLSGRCGCHSWRGCSQGNTVPFHLGTPAAECGGQ